MDISGFVLTVGRAIRHGWVGDHGPSENDPSSQVVFVMGAQQRRWTARATEAASRYLVAHHRWIIGTLLIAAPF